jgi:hypothetical protein
MSDEQIELFGLKRRIGWITNLQYIGLKERNGTLISRIEVGMSNRHISFFFMQP